jgi:hypothetical protein
VLDGDVGGVRGDHHVMQAVGLQDGVLDRLQLRLRLVEHHGQGNAAPECRESSAALPPDVR